jgi:hypothetical protein
MSSTDARRYKRKMERDIKKGKIEEYLKIPTEQDVEEYIMEKSNKITYTPVEVLQPVDITTKL